MSNDRLASGVATPGARIPSVNVSRDFYCFFSVAVVVREPSPCCVVVLLRDSPVAGFVMELLWLDAPDDGLDDVTVVLFCPSGFSVVDELVVVCANAPAESARHSPNPAITILNVRVMEFPFIMKPVEHQSSALQLSLAR